MSRPCDWIAFPQPVCPSHSAGALFPPDLAISSEDAAANQQANCVQVNSAQPAFGRVGGQASWRHAKSVVQQQQIGAARRQPSTRGTCTLACRRGTAPKMQKLAFRGQTRRGCRVMASATAVRTVKIGTRGSPLALAQAYLTRDLLKVCRGSGRASREHASRQQQRAADAPLARARVESSSAGRSLTSPPTEQHPQQQAWSHASPWQVCKPSIL